MNLADEITNVRDAVLRLRTLKDSQIAGLKVKVEKLAELKAEHKLFTKAAIVSQQLADCKRGAMNTMFSETVSGALKDTFDNSYAVSLDYSTKNNRSTCDFTLTTCDYKGYLPLKMCHGKSVREIISIVLRIMLVNMLGGDIIILDEPLEGLQTPREHIMADFLKNIIKTFGIQFIIVSQLDSFVNTADSVLKISKGNLDK